MKEKNRLQWNKDYFILFTLNGLYKALQVDGMQ
jgi:hypothetical protein